MGTCFTFGRIMTMYVTLSGLITPEVWSRTVYDTNYDRIKQQEYGKVIQTVLSMGYQSQHFEMSECEAWCGHTIPSYFSPNMDLTPKCHKECTAFFLHQSPFQDKRDL